MPVQHFKYNTGATINNTTQKGNIAIATGGSQDWGPTSVTGFYPETAPPPSGYTIYFMRSTGGPSVHIANNDAQAIFFLKSFGSTGSTISDVLSWASGQSNYYVQTGTTSGTTPTPTPSITPTHTPTPTITPTISVTPTNTVTPTPTITSTVTPTMTPTPSGVAIQYYYGTTQALAYGMTSGLTGVNLYGQTLCAANSIGANEFNSLPSTAPIYIYDSATGNMRACTPLGYYPSANFNLGNCTYQYGRYRIATTENGVCTSYTGVTDVVFYNTDICTATSFGSNQLTGLTSGTYYLYDTVTTYERTFSNPYSYNTLFTLVSSCTTNPCTGTTRTGYYYSTTSADAVTGGTQATGVVFGTGQSGDTMCNPSTISFYANGFSGLTPGSYFLYDGDANKVRAFTLYGGSNYGSMSGTCSTPSGGARSGYWYASSRPAAITGGTQVTDVTFNGGSNDLCSCYNATSYTAFSSLNGYIYIYNGDTGDVRQFYGSNNQTISAMSSCLNTNTPVYYYSTMSNDCYGNSTLTNVTFSGGASICSASGFSANELSSLSPNTYYLRDPFTDTFRQFYCAYNGSVSFTNSCTQYSC